MFDQYILHYLVDDSLICLRYTPDFKRCDNLCFEFKTELEIGLYGLKLVIIEEFYDEITFAILIDKICYWFINFLFFLKSSLIHHLYYFF